MGSRFSIAERIRSFRYAFEGIFSFIKSQHNAWIHLFLALLAIIGGFVFNISQTEWLVIIICISMVLAAEAINSAIENLVDLASPNLHPLAKKAKDQGAGAVLIMSIGSFIVAMIIFIPKILVFFKI